jgi:3-deoxy-D-manno-octulosonic-acid transferase
VEQGRALRAALRKPVVMLASSREGEESQWLQALNTMDEVPDCHWLLVPRHPQRFDAVADLLRGAGLSFARRSQHGVVADWTAVPAEVWLGDSLGEMALYYGLADLALLGGSFAPLGGQNLIEAAACGCTVVMGPHTFNFSEAAERAVAADAAIRVADMAGALEAVAHLLKSDARKRHAHAQSFAAAYGGAVARTVGALVALQPRLT